MMIGIVFGMFVCGVVVGLAWHDPLLRTLARRRGEVYVVTLRSAKTGPRRRVSVEAPQQQPEQN